MKLYSLVFFILVIFSYGLNAQSKINEVSFGYLKGNSMISNHPFDFFSKNGTINKPGFFLGYNHSFIRYNLGIRFISQNSEINYTEYYGDMSKLDWQYKTKTNFNYLQISLVKNKKIFKRLYYKYGLASDIHLYSYSKHNITSNIVPNGNYGRKGVVLTPPLFEFYDNSIPLKKINYPNMSFSNGLIFDLHKISVLVNYNLPLLPILRGVKSPIFSGESSNYYQGSFSVGLGFNY